MNQNFVKLLLADDDPDDCLLFKEALDELPVNSSLETVNDGAQLMKLLTLDSIELPDLLFLDLNMPRKSGHECLAEIKMNAKLRSLPVIIYSTSFDSSVVDSLYEKGAHNYIRKPGEFSQLKNVILKALNIAAKETEFKPSKENFVIQG